MHILQACLHLTDNCFAGTWRTAEADRQPQSRAGHRAAQLLHRAAAHLLPHPGALYCTLLSSPAHGYPPHSPPGAARQDGGPYWRLNFEVIN